VGGRYGAVVTEIPTWLLWLIGAFIPIVTAAVGFTNAAFNIAASRRKEAMELLRWAGEQAVAPGNAPANLMGVQALNGLKKGALLKGDDRWIMYAVTQAVLAPSVAAYSEAEEPPEIDVLPVEEAP
jgi:hypothetical protein